MNKHLLGFYNYTVILTYSGMLIAFLGIIFLINSIPKPAILCLMISGLCDMWFFQTGSQIFKFTVIRLAGSTIYQKTSYTGRRL